MDYFCSTHATEFTGKSLSKGSGKMNMQPSCCTGGYGGMSGKQL